MPRFHTTVFARITLLTLLCCTAATAQEKLPQGVSVLYASQQDGRDEIFVMDPDGSGARNLTDHRAKDCHPSVSADGRTIVFNSERVGWWKIWSMDRKGGNVRQLTDATSADYYPSLSPDGTRIAFASGRGGGSHLWTMQVDGSGLTRLPGSKGENNFPAWSPDGRRLAFASDRSGTWEIYVMDGDADNVTQVTSGPGAKLEPAWYPDGVHLVYQAQRDRGVFDLKVSALGGRSAERWLTDTAADEKRPAVSPDGRWILFESRDGNSSHIHLMASDGTSRRQLTRTGYNYGPAWLPDLASKK